jgi:hypothetical protein
MLRWRRHPPPLRRYCRGHVSHRGERQTARRSARPLPLYRASIAERVDRRIGWGARYPEPVRARATRDRTPRLSIGARERGRVWPWGRSSTGSAITAPLMSSSKIPPPCLRPREPRANRAGGRKDGYLAVVHLGLALVDPIASVWIVRAEAADELIVATESDKDVVPARSAN